MSVDKRGLEQLQHTLEQIRRDMPDFMDQLVVQEGEVAVREAKSICTEDHISPSEKGSTGDYRKNWACDKKAQRAGRIYRVGIFNNLVYAKHLEYGFRGHFVPGHWEGNSFVYNPGDPKGGMYVPYQRGRFVLKRAMHRVKVTQEARLQRKTDKWLEGYHLEGKA